MEQKTCNILSIDAWAEGEDSWTWNQWFKVGSCPLSLVDQPKESILEWFYREGFIRQTEEGDIEDDGHNVVIVDAKTREPIFAIEYGIHY